VVPKLVPDRGRMIEKEGDYVTSYRLVMKVTPDSGTWETQPIERDSLEVGEVLEVEGYPGRWRVVSPHVAADSDEAEPNAFDCEPIAIVDAESRWRSRMDS
jgi:hypothetical protein